MPASAPVSRVRLLNPCEPPKSAKMLSDMHDLRGRRIGRLVAIKQQPKVLHNKPVMFWLCRCDCGNETAVRTTCLTQQLTQSCGCLEQEVRYTNRRTHGFTTGGKW